MTHLTYPNESAEYRAARNALLAEEMALREHIEAVASRRGAAPCPRAAPYQRITFSSGSARTTCPRAFGCPVSLASTVR